MQAAHFCSSRLRVLFVALLAAIALVGCAAHVSGLSHDPRFDYHSAVARRFPVGGVVSSLDESVDGDLGTMLVQAFNEELPAYTVDNSGSFAAALSEQDYRSLLRELRQTSSVSAETLSTIRSEAQIRQYIVFVHLANQEVSQSRHSFDRVGHVVDGRYHLSSTRTMRQTSRSVTVVAMVVDPVDGMIVWRGSVGPRVSNTNHRRTHYLFSRSDYKWYYPAPPPLARAVQAAFAGFVENLPHAD